MIPRAKLFRSLILGATLSAAFAFVTLAPVAIQAQADLGSIGGTIADASGAVIAKASVTVTNLATGAVRTTVTNSTGGFQISQLLPGDYTVTVTAAGFAPAKDTVSVTVGSNNNFSAKLAVAGGKTEVTVQADNFAGVQLEKPEVSAVIETEQIQSLPTQDRNPYNLVAYSGNLSSDPTASSRGVGFNISGARSTSVDILLDGTENTDLYGVGIGQTVPMDATSEIRIVTSNSGAEYGRGSGAVNVSTKSGTNQFHGSVYEYNRISTFASDGFNNNYLHDFYGVAAKPRYTHNQFGYSVGGPLKKDKVFFFSSTEWTRIRSAQNIVATVPTSGLIGLSASNMQDFFSTYGKLQYPINGSTYTGASPAVQNVFGPDVTAIGLAEMGLPSDTPVKNSCADPQISSAAICTTALFGQSIYQAPADSGGGVPVNQWISFNRGDWTINQTTSMFVRYIQQSTVNPAGSNNSSPYDGYNTGSTQKNHNLEVSISKAFSPTLASATKLLGARFNNSQPLGQKPVSPTLYINAGSPVSLGGGTINLPGYLATSPGDALPFGGPQNFIQVGEDLAWTKGKHQFTFGGNVLYIKDNRTFGAYEEAVDGLVATGTSRALENFIAGGMEYLNVAIDPSGVYPCKRFLDGKYPGQGGHPDDPTCKIQEPVHSPNFSRSNRYLDGAAYVSDSYKVNSQLTLNLGIRYEIYGPQHSQKAGYDANFFLGSGDDVWDRIRNGQVLTRDKAPNSRLWNLNKAQFGPKIGFAIDPVGNGKTSIRGGVGINYERNFNNVTFNVIQNPPNYAVVAFTTADNGGATIPVSTNNFSTFGTGTGLKQLPNVTLRGVDPDIKPAYAGNWSLSVEHQFGSSTASLSYVGTRGIHNYSIANINRVFSGSNYLGDGHISNRTNLQYSNINWRGADGDSYYGGVTGELRTADLMHTGLMIRADYTYSHSIDNTSSAFSDSGNEAGGGLVLGYLDPFNKALDRGSSDFDQKHRVATAMVWTVPFAKHTTGLTKAIADNWTLSTTFNAQTGTPFTMFDCSNAYTVCVRPSFNEKVDRKKTGNGMTNLSSTLGANTYSYTHLPDFWDANGNITSAYNEQTNPYTGTSDTPICGGIHNVDCHYVPNMDGRNNFRGPGSWDENLGIVKDFKIHDRYDVQLKGEFINVFNHANTYLNLGGTNDVSSYTDVLAYKSGNRNTELSLHLSF
ncbi:MAG: TonB-dependent receptor [Terracidiphilus sp.]